MSLRLKGLIAFLSLGFIPMFVMAIHHFGRIQDTISDQSAENLEASARSTAAALEGRFTHVESGLRRLSLELTADEPTPTAIREERVDELLRELGGVEARLQHSLLSLRHEGEDGALSSTVWTTSPPVAGSDVCAYGSARPEVRVSESTRARAGSLPSPVLVARVSPSVLLPTDPSRAVGRTFVVDRMSGAVTSTSPCENDSTVADLIESAMTPEEVAGVHDPGGKTRRAVADGRIASVVDVPGTPWTVVTEGPDLATSLESMQVAYLSLLILIGLGSAMVFSILIGRQLRTLDELREAARRIGDGDLAPWLPPPGEDEVGWLSLALRRMTERMTHLVRRIDQTSRLEVAGIMASHLAHELRTPLSSIRLNLQGLSRELDAGRLPPDHEPNVRISLREVSRLERTVGTVLQLAGGRAATEGEATLCSLHRIVVETSRLLGNVLREKDVEIMHDLQAEADTVRADEGRLRSVFMNLLVNASEAMPGGGTITVESRLFLDHHGGHAVALAVSDTGPGIPEGVRSEIFNPFFTTKSEGSGIGLPMALRSVREEGGDLFLDESREPGCGARFVVVLPTAENRPAPNPNGHPGTKENGVRTGGRWARGAGPIRELEHSPQMEASAGTDTDPLRASGGEQNGGR